MLLNRSAVRFGVPGVAVPQIGHVGSRKVLDRLGELTELGFDLVVNDADA